MRPAPYGGPSCPAPPWGAGAATFALAKAVVSAGHQRGVRHGHARGGSIGPRPLMGGQGTPSPRGGRHRSLGSGRAAGGECVGARGTGSIHCVGVRGERRVRAGRIVVRSGGGEGRTHPGMSARPERGLRGTVDDRRVSRRSFLFGRELRACAAVCRACGIVHAGCGCEMVIGASTARGGAAGLCMRVVRDAVQG